MAVVFTEVKSINDYQKGIGYNLKFAGFNLGDLIGTYVPSDESKIKEIYEWGVTTRTPGNTFTVVKFYDPNTDRDVLQITSSILNTTYDIWCKGRVA